MKIPFMDLYESNKTCEAEVLRRIGEIIRESAFIGGKEVDLFENEFAAYCNCQYSVSCTNGTDAILLALKALGIGSGDTVLVPVNTFIATAEAVIATGAEVEFIDVEDTFYNMDADKLRMYLEENKGTKRIKAVIPVHLYGHMANMPRIREIAKTYSLFIIEDSAQAHGALLDDLGPGHWGNIATFSFFPGKNLGAFGDAGAVVTNDESLYLKMKMLVNHGRSHSKYEHEMVGYNKRINVFQAAVLRVKLKKLDNWIQLRQEKARLYHTALTGQNVILPGCAEKHRHARHLYVIRLKNRDEIFRKLADKGIAAGIHYPIPLHLQPAFKYKGYKQTDFPVAEKLAGEILSLPFWPEISAETIEEVCAVLKSGLADF